ncbi:hypothetical protein NPS58_03850 [Pseudomonas putida]|uniref:hypothetical protein n=1 Tax=Pseudomonas putida TaxID=303 RepID=UPI002363A59B|nr:hypothetical protein [Pseudomonas putida]MDD2056579.1 hypothetical protein [Pseudomonas putida]
MLFILSLDMTALARSQAKVTKPTVKGGLAPANAVDVKGMGAGGERYLTCIWSGQEGPGFAYGDAICIDDSAC